MKNQNGGHRRAKHVRDAMQHTVIGVVPEMTVSELVCVLLENSAGGVPVLDPRGKAMGVVSMLDVLRCVAPGMGSMDECRVRDIMEPVGFTLAPLDSLETAARLMYGGGVHPILVTEDGVLVGTITPADILRSLEWQAVDVA